MKVYLTDEKELIMEPCLKWAANPNILVAVKAFGLKATVQVIRYPAKSYLNLKEWTTYLKLAIMIVSHLPRSFLSGGRSASFCSASYHSQAISPKFSLFCQHLCVSYGKGLWYNLFLYKFIFVVFSLIIRSWVELCVCDCSLLLWQPHVDFGLKLGGADLMSIPGLYRIVQVNIFLIHHSDPWLVLLRNWFLRGKVWLIIVELFTLI